MPIALATILAVVPPALLAGSLARLARAKAPIEPHGSTASPR